MDATDHFKLPKFWPRVWALDVDHARASVLWAAHDRESDTLYVYAELVMPRHELALVADAIKKRASWAPGLFDHLARGRAPQSGQMIIEAMLDLHLDVFAMQVDPDAGAAEVARRLATKRLKVFSTCNEWLSQYRAYRRNKDGDLVEESDGLMRAMDLLALSGPQIAMADVETLRNVDDDWAGQSRCDVTGY